MFGPDPDQVSFLNNLQAVVGPIQELTSLTNPRSDWLFAATFRGRAVEIGLDRGGYFSYVRYSIPLAVPVRMFVDGHYVSYSQAAMVITGDPEFDRRYAVHANPPEVVGAALDAATRQWYLASYGDRPPQTDTRNGMLRLFHCFRPTGTTQANIPPPAQIAHFLEALLCLADRLASCFMQQKASIAAAYGPAAAEQWQAAQVAALEAIRRRRTRIRTYVFLGVALMIGVPLVVAIVNAFFMVHR